MSKKIFYSPLAQQDLAEISDYIAEELGSPITAAGIVEEILDRVDLLAQFPESGTPLSSICSIQSSYPICDFLRLSGVLPSFRCSLRGPYPSSEKGLSQGSFGRRILV